MTDRLNEPRAAYSGADTIPALESGRSHEVESLLLRALHLLHAHPLTAEQQKDMAQALSDQIAATSRLRSFVLCNDDAPYFVPVSAGAFRNV